MMCFGESEKFLQEDVKEGTLMCLTLLQQVSQRCPPSTWLRLHSFGPLVNMLKATLAASK